jgi:peptide/nickel transport system substrate-binding protein
MLVASARDTRLMTIFSYTRLIVYDDKFKLKPDILESYEEKDGREFTFKLRAGHKWSNGHPFTTEDFRFFWEDVANNKDLSSGGPNVELLVDGQPPKVEIIDPLTIKYTWDKPNPYFIESQARAAPLFLFRPAHYLKKFHAKYTPEAEILKSARGGQQSWVSIYRRLDVMYANDNVDLPTLNPWVGTTASPGPALRLPAQSLLSPHRREGAATPLCRPGDLHGGGGQSGAGQGRPRRGRSAAALSQHARLYVPAEERAELGHERAPVGGGLGITARALSQPQRQRRGMAQAHARRALPAGALAGDRPRGTEPGRLYRPRQAVEQHDHGALGAFQAGVRDQVGAVRSQARQQAPGRNRPEEEGQPGHPAAARRPAGDDRRRACQRGDRGQRCARADRGRLEEDRHQDADQAADPRQLPASYLVGRSHHDGLRGRGDGGADTQHQPQGVRADHAGRPAMARWGMFVESKGKQGEKCDMESACKLLDYVKEWETGTTEEDRRKAWDKILATNADEVFSIGTVNGVRQPIVVGPKVRNVPKEGYYAWDPGGYIGLYQPDTFWIAG